MSAFSSSSPRIVAAWSTCCLAVGAPVGDHRLDLRVLARVEGLEREVLELPLERVDPEPVRERRVDLERLLRLLHLLLLAEVLDRPHVVEAVGELDEDDPHVLGHRDDHLAVVLRLGLLAARNWIRVSLVTPSTSCAISGAELRAQLVELGLGVLDDVVEQRGRDRLLVEVELGADPRDAPGMVDEVLAGAAELALVPALGASRTPAGCRSRSTSGLYVSTLASSSSTRFSWCCSVPTTVMDSVYGPDTRVPPGRRRLAAEREPDIPCTWCTPTSSAAGSAG